jgi:uncharacterized protein YndB with AHSA1/START domain
MGDDKQLAASRTIDAPAERIFAVLADPRQHVRIDGSGCLQGTESGPVDGVGQVFVMDMFRDDMGPWHVANHVTEYQPGVALGWAPILAPDCALAKQLSHITPGGQTYTYRLRETDGGTEVTQVYDWSGVTDPNFEAFCPFVSREQLAATLDRLATAVEGGR